MIKVLHHFREVYGLRSSEMKVSLRILKHIRKEKHANLRHLTFTALKEIGLVEEDVVLMRVLAVLAGPSYPIFDQKFEFFDEDDDDYVDIAPETVLRANESGRFDHPRSGQPVSDFQSRIFVYYQVGEDCLASFVRTLKR